MMASARLDNIVERLTACALPVDVRLALEDAAALVAAASRSKRNKVLTELFWVGKNGKDITREGKKRAIQDLKDRGSVHETKGGKLKLTKKGVDDFAAISKKKAELVEKGVRKHATFEEREAIQASFAERANKLMAASNLPPAFNRNNALFLMIPIPDKYAKRFPDPVIANHGRRPHLTVLYVGNKEYSPGEISQIVNCVRAACKKVPPFRLYVDPNTGLRDFGPNEETGEKALWLPARAEPRGEVERLHRIVRIELEREGIEVGAHDPFVPHVTWAYVPNDQGPDARRRMDAHVADRFQDGFYFDVRHVMLSMPDGRSKPLALSPLPRK